MKIDFDKNVVNFIPENTLERTKLNALWRTIISCNSDSRSITPIGEYVPQTPAAGASFVIEGYEGKSYFNIPVLEKCQVYCDTCNKLLELNPGDLIPPCCGKLMEIVE